jgi:sterol desaturase/sphingolipid hydroxylase (fatty acid hydroxylase superfamily)
MADFLEYGLLFAAGFLLWPLLEYAVHGWLSHRFRTFVSPLHWEHHQDPRRVFTSILAWGPSALLVFALGAAVVGPVASGALSGGVLAGFLRYEYVHWRIHFRAPRNERQRRQRAHHLAHHFRDPKAYFGVTTSFFDRLFGSLPERYREDYERVIDHPPLRGASNFGTILPRKAASAPR